MSTLSSSETTTRLATLPRVNLLPPEIEVQRRAKKVQGALGLGVVAAAGIVGVLVLAANGQVSDAKNQLEAEQARNSALEAQAAEYAEVPAVYAAVDVAETELTRAMNKEIRWSYFLNDLSLATPGKVWLTSVTVTENVDATPVAAAPAVAGAATYWHPEHRDRDGERQGLHAQRRGVLAAGTVPRGRSRGPVLHAVDRRADRHTRTL